MENKTPLQRAVEIIQEEVKVERIYLMNSMDHLDQNYFAFTTNMYGAYVYKLCIIVRGTRKPYHTIRLNIKNRYNGSTPIDIMAIPLKKFRQSLDSKSWFEIRLQETACLLYDASDPRSEQDMPEESHKWLQDMRGYLGRDFNIGFDFLHAAEAHLKTKDFRLAAFCLYQAMEYFMSVVEKIITGYREKVQNIHDRYRFSLYILPEMSIILPHHQERQRRIHRILNGAYESGTQPIPEAELHAMLADLYNIQKVIRGSFEWK